MSDTFDVMGKAKKVPLEGEEEGFAFPDKITITLEDDTVMECEILSIFPIGEQNYILVNPDLDEGGLLVYRFDLDEQDNPLLDNIADEQEEEMVSEYLEKVIFPALSGEGEEEEDGQ